MTLGLGRRALVGVSVAVLLLAGVVAAVTHQDDPGVVAAGVATTSTTVQATVTTTAPPTTTAAAPATTAPARQPATTATTRRATATTAPPQIATTILTRPTRTTRPAVPACTAAQLVATGAPARPTFGPGEIVFVNMGLKNRSTTTCSHTGFTVEIVFRNDVGDVLDRTSTVSNLPVPVSLAPGQTISAPGRWVAVNQLPGQYSARATWTFVGARFEATATFELTD